MAQSVRRHSDSTREHRLLWVDFCLLYMCSLVRGALVNAGCGKRAHNVGCSGRGPCAVCPCVRRNLLAKPKLRVLAIAIDGTAKEGSGNTVAGVTLTYVGGKVCRVCCQAPYQ